MSSFNIVIMGFGKMPADCAQILLNQKVTIEEVWETEANAFSALEGFCKRKRLAYKRLGAAAISQSLRLISNPTVIFSINNNYLFPATILEKPNLKIINFHNSLLPSYRGHGQIIPTWVIYKGETRHGVTWHLIDRRLDGGNILAQAEFTICRDDTALSVMIRSVSLGTDLFAEHCQRFLAVNCSGQPQTTNSAHIYRLSDLPNNGLLDIAWPFDEACRFLRSMDYGHFKILPHPEVEIGGTLFRILKYTIEEHKNTVTAGKVVSLHPELSPASAELRYDEGTINILLERLSRYEN